MKVNVDAAVDGECRKGAVVVVYRDQEGRFLGASSITHRFILNPTILEALVVREGHEVVADLYLNNIQSASDCKIVVEGIK